MKLDPTKKTTSAKQTFIISKYLCYLLGIVAFIFYLCYVAHKGERIATSFGIIANLCVILAIIAMYICAYIKFKGKYTKYSGLFIWHARDIGWGASFNPYSLAGKVLWLCLMAPFAYYLYTFLVK